MVTGVQTYIRRMNGLHTQFLESAGVQYYNKLASLKDKKTIIVAFLIFFISPVNRP
jgi:hypothetical protein